MELGPYNRDRLAHLQTGFAASESDLLCMADNLVASTKNQASGLSLANHVLQEVEVRQQICEIIDTMPGARRSRPGPILSTDSFKPSDLQRLTNMQKKLVEIQQTGDRVIQGLAGMVLLKVTFLLEPRAW